MQALNEVNNFAHSFPEWIKLKSDAGNGVKNIVINQYYPFYHFLKDGEKVYDVEGDITCLKLKSVIEKIKQLNAKISLRFLREIEDSEFEGTIMEYLTLELIWDVSMRVDGIK